MQSAVSRRSAVTMLTGLAALPLAGCGTEDAKDVPRKSSGSPSASAAAEKARRAFVRLERKFDARLGVYALDTGSRRSIAHRADERFAYCSTCKAFLAGTVLKRNSLREMERRVRVRPQDLEGYSPIARKHVGSTMSLRELCDAAVRYSDNAAANLLFRELGGPKGLQDALRDIGDRVTGADRYEVELSEGTPGDSRDTSTPRALATDLRAFVLGDVLPGRKREVLTDWLKRNTTGDKLIRAGAPRGWEVGDKTGNGGYGTRNDIAVLWPPKGDPITLAIMSRRDTRDAEHDDALIAEAAEVALGALE